MSRIAPEGPDITIPEPPGTHTRQRRRVWWCVAVVVVIQLAIAGWAVFAGPPR